MCTQNAIVHCHCSLCNFLTGMGIFKLGQMAPVAEIIRCTACLSTLRCTPRTHEHLISYISTLLLFFICKSSLVKSQGQSHGKTVLSALYFFWILKNVRTLYKPFRPPALSSQSGWAWVFGPYSWTGGVQPPSISLPPCTIRPHHQQTLAWKHLTHKHLLCQSSNIPCTMSWSHQSINLSIKIIINHKGQQ